MNNQFSDRLRWAMEAKSERDQVTVIAADIMRAAKVSGAAVTHWLNGVGGISAVKARLVADYLGVDALWLETGSGTPERKHRAQQPHRPDIRPPGMPWIAEDAYRLLTLYYRTDDDGREKIMRVAENMPATGQGNREASDQA